MESDAEKALTWRTQQHDRPSDSLTRLQRGFQAKRYANTAHGNKVMPTRVAHGRERVHLGVDANGAPAPALRVFGPPCCGESQVVFRHLEALLR